MSNPDNENYQEEEAEQQTSYGEGSWECAFCGSIEHSEREPLYSVYYSRQTSKGVIGPKFCSHNCLCNWKISNARMSFYRRHKDMIKPTVKVVN